ncbi:MAG TPA: pentapeptide repeat-containing protein [Crinalium sp.]|jgi:uncharacterized protein YjbI with pentapeptide repeats
MDQSKDQSKPSSAQRWKPVRLGCISIVTLALLGIGVIKLAVHLDIQETKASMRILKRTGNCRGCDLSFANLSGYDLQFADLEGADLRDADLSGAVLGAANLSDADLRYADLEGAILRQANLYNAKFDHANLTDADFHCGAGTCTTLDGASFRNANLTRAIMFCLDCFPEGERIGLDGVDLRDANLTGANLERSRLDRANTEGARFCNTTLWNGKVSNQDC